MSYEVEIKAHVQDSQLVQLKQKLSGFPGSRVLGDVKKNDTYFAVRETDHHLFRVRLQSIGDHCDVLVTAKPLRTYEGTEINKELEFHSLASEVQTVKDFFISLGYTVCLQKEKEGWACIVPVNGFDITAEVLEVKPIGTYLEMEITSIQSCEEESLISKAQKALLQLLKDCGISEKAIESRPYRQMILQARNAGQKA